MLVRNTSIQEGLIEFFKHVGSFSIMLCSDLRQSKITLKYPEKNYYPTFYFAIDCCISYYLPAPVIHIISFSYRYYTIIIPIFIILALFCFISCFLSGDKLSYQRFLYSCLPFFFVLELTYCIFLCFFYRLHLYLYNNNLTISFL